MPICITFANLLNFSGIITIMDSKNTSKDHSRFYSAKSAERLARPKISDEHLFKLLLSELPDAIYFKDREGRFFLTNRLHTKKMGLSSAQDFIGKTDFDLFSEKHAREAFDDEQNVIQSGITISKEEKETRLDGSETWASTSKMPLKNEHGETVGTFGISKDITQIKNAEIQLREARRILQEANDAKDKFFSILAHDLKNPFNSLLGLSEILVEDFDKLANDEKLGMVKKIQSTSESAYALLENLLDWSRVQRGSMHIEPESTNLKQLLDEVIALNYLQAFNKNISLYTNIKAELRVFADPNMLKTIIRNLVSNAIKFTMPGGEVKISGHSDEDNTHILVEDNGIGMSAETCKKLFSISEKNKTYGTNDESGTGLGLIICQEFAAKNKGDIKVSSHEGVGSTFTIILPKG